MRFTPVVSLLILCSGFLAPLSAQSDSSSVYRLTLSDGSEFRGVVLSRDSSLVRFRSLGGVELEIPQSSIASLEEERGSWREGRFLRHDPNQTRLFFAPTARSLQTGDGYFSVYQIFFPMVAVGISDWLSIAGGLSLFPGTNSQLLYFAPKVQAVHTEHLDVSFGVLYLKIPEVDRGVGISYGVLTAGNPRAAVTFGLGWGFIGEDFSDGPSIVIGGETQVSESVKLLSENWIPAGSDLAILSFGVRFFGEHLAGDFGLMTTTESGDGFPFIPWVGFVYNF